MSTIVDFLTKPETIAVAVGAVMFLVKMVLGENYAKNEALFAMGVEVAYNIVNDVAKRTPNEVDDKVAMGLKALRDYFATHNKVLSPAQVDRAKLLFQSMNGAGK